MGWDTLIKSGTFSLVLIVTTFLFFFSTGFIWIENSWLHTFSRELFRTLCHQFPWRTISHDGQLMAVCSRCFGIYFGLFLGTVIMPFIFLKLSILKNQTTRILAGVIILNVIDFIGNLAGLWTNTLYSRLVLGLLFGISVILLIFSAYLNQILKKSLWNQSNKNRTSTSLS